MPQQSLVVERPRVNRPNLAGAAYPVYLQAAPDTVVLAVAAPLLLTNNRTLSTNLVATTATNTFTIAAPPCNGFIKGVNQVTSGACTITPVSGVTIYSGATVQASVAVPAKSSVQLIGFGNDWHVIEQNTPNFAPVLAGSFNPVYLTAKPDVVASASSLALILTNNQTVSTNGSGTNSFTIAPPPVDGFIKVLTQTGAGNATVVVSGGATLNNGVTPFTTLTVPATSGECTLIGSGVGWYILNIKGSVTAT